MAGRGKRAMLVLLTALCALLLLALPARAVTITEFEIEAGSLPGAHEPRYIEAGLDGNLWFTQGGVAPGIGRVTPAGQMLGVLPEPQGPVDLLAGPDGTIYWGGTKHLGRRTPGGVVESYPVNGTVYALALNSAEQLRWAGQRDNGLGQVCRFGESGAWGSPDSCGYGGDAATTPVTALSPVGDGTFWAAYSDVDEVRRIPAASASNLMTITLPPGSGPERIAPSPDGRSWVTMFEANAIDSLLPDGARQRFPLPPGIGPNDIVFGPDGALWFTGFDAGTIGRMTLDGAVTTYAVPTPNSAPQGIAVGPDGNIWFTESGTGKIGRLVPDGPPPTGPPPTGPPSGDTAPSFTQAPTFAPQRFAVAGRGKGPKGVPRGSKLTFALSESSTVTASIAKRLPGHKAGKLCIAPGKAKAGAKKCTRFVTMGTLSGQLGTGAGSIAFNGKLNGKALTPGAYRATVSATDAAGNLSAASFATFTIAG